MTNQEIYEAALRLCGEQEDHTNNADYKKRAPQLLAVFCQQNARLDRIVREANGSEPQTLPSALSLPLADAFPLSDAFASAAAYWLAGMLTTAENTSIGDRFLEQAQEALKAIRKEVPFRLENIRSVYS